MFWAGMISRNTLLQYRGWPVQRKGATEQPLAQTVLPSWTSEGSVASDAGKMASTSLTEGLSHDAIKLQETRRSRQH
eukprot:1137560-Pelagomonas_calceolata.AAC.2